MGGHLAPITFCIKYIHQAGFMNMSFSSVQCKRHLATHTTSEHGKSHSDPIAASALLSTHATCMYTHKRST